MDPLTGGLLAFGGGLITNLFNRQNAQDQMGFQREMSGTAYQRAVEDMQLAGLNPMLAYSQGGASTPQGAMPQVNDMIGGGVTTALQAQQVNAQVEQLRTAAELNEAQAGKARAEMYTELGRPENVAAHTQQLRSSASQAQQAAGHIDAMRRHVEELIKTAPEERARIVQQRFTDFERMVLFGIQQKSTAAEINRIVSQTNLNDINTLLQKLKEPEARAEAAFYEGAVGQHAPAIRMGMDAIKTGAAAVSPFKLNIGKAAPKKGVRTK